MSEASIIIKRNHTTRIGETAAVNNAPASLVGREVRVVLINDQIEVFLTELAGVGFTNEAAGQYWWEVTAANLAALDEPDRISVALTIFNADNTIFMADSLTANVEW